MKDRPILFNGAMVRALLAGTKTQTRRVVKPRNGGAIIGFGGPGIAMESLGVVDGCEHVSTVLCPYGQPGDRLWVRETFARIDGQTRPWIETDYQATYTHGDRLGDTLGIKKRWTPSIHMPRHASRITLEISDVRIERLQSISEADARAEGAEPNDGYAGPEEGRAKGWRKGYRQLWEQINGPGSWEANHWVWVLEFRRASI